MNTQNNSALVELVARNGYTHPVTGAYGVVKSLEANAEAFARALMSHCPDLVIVPREPTAKMAAVIENENCKYETMPEFYDALLLAAQPAAQEK